MADGRYEVSEPAKVREEFRGVLDRARELGILPLVVLASRWILEELARTPMNFGESREHREHLDLHLRIGFAPPVFVQFAVHDEQPIVFIRGFALCDAPG